MSLGLYQQAKMIHYYYLGFTQHFSSAQFKGRPWLIKTEVFGINED